MKQSPWTWLSAVEATPAVIRRQEPWDIWWTFEAVVFSMPCLLYHLYLLIMKLLWFHFKCSPLFSCDQAALWMVFSVRPSVRPSVRLSVCLSVCHTFLPLSPPGWRGIVVTVRAGGRAGWLAGGRAGGRLPDLRNPYLCNRLMDFLRSKLYGIV